MPPNLKQAVPFFAVADIEASVRFYVDGLGFRITKQWTPGGKLRWCWLERDGAALMLQQFQTEGHDGWVPKSKVGIGVSIVFICADALALYREFKSRGLAPSQPFVGNNMWVTTLSDPDGYRLEWESDTDVEEGTLLAEAEA